MHGLVLGYNVRDRGAIDKFVRVHDLLAARDAAVEIDDGEALGIPGNKKHTVIADGTLRAEVAVLVGPPELRV
jgi:hypothetical protein